jgi:hypothetical protein
MRFKFLALLSDLPSDPEWLAVRCVSICVRDISYRRTLLILKKAYADVLSFMFLCNLLHIFFQVSKYVQWHEYMRPMESATNYVIICFKTNHLYILLLFIIFN